jgi:hypothetical protein
MSSTSRSTPPLRSDPDTAKRTAGKDEPEQDRALAGIEAYTRDTEERQQPYTIVLADGSSAGADNLIATHHYTPDGRLVPVISSYANATT